MSKNVNVNGTSYSGVSQVQLNTTDGGTATFKDVDEIVTPSGSKTITTNGTHDVTDYASAIVNVPTSGGSGADVDMGSFVGDNTYLLTLPTTKKRSHVMIYTHAAPEDIWAAVGLEKAYPLKILFLMDNVETNDDYTEANAVRGQYRCFLNGAANSLTVLAINTPSNVVTFGDDSISLTKYFAVNTSVFAQGIQFHWLAW